MSLWTMIRYAASPQDKALVHGKLADYYAAHNHPRRAAAERARASYWLSLIHP